MQTNNPNSQSKIFLSGLIELIKIILCIILGHAISISLFFILGYPIYYFFPYSLYFVGGIMFLSYLFMTIFYLGREKLNIPHPKDITIDILTEIIKEYNIRGL